MTKEDQETLVQFHSKIVEALREVINNEDSENYIPNDELTKGNNATIFMHALANTVPAYIYQRLTNENVDVLGFNHIANRLCYQFKASKE